MPAEILMGNEAIAFGLVEAGCRVVTAYPGTPSSEILAGVVKFKKQFGREIYTEWCGSEKETFAVTLAASWSGRRSATAMKQFGPPFTTASSKITRRSGIPGGSRLIFSDDPGPMS